MTVELADIAKGDAALAEHLEIGPVDGNSDTGTKDGVLSALRNNKWAVLWCFYAIWVILVSAFDFSASTVVIGIPQFRKDFGSAYAGDYVLPANWQSAYSAAPVASGVFGSFFAGWIGDMVGKKPTFLAGYIVVFVGITVQIIATTNPVFFVGKLIGGFAIGIGTTTSFSYMVEISPMVLRGILIAAGASAYTVAQLAVALIVNYVSDRQNRWAYRGLFLGQYVITFLGVIFLPFLPESPYWLISVAKRDKAARSLRKLGYSNEEISGQIESIQNTLDTATTESGGISYVECFQRNNLRRTIIAVLPGAIQNFARVYFVGAYLVYFAQLLGYSSSGSFKIGIAQQVASMVGFILSWFIIDQLGRRILSVYGVAIEVVLLAIGGGLTTSTNPTCIRTAIAIFIIFQFACSLTMGSAGFVILTETPTSRLRIKTAALAMIVQNACLCVLALVIPYVFNPDKANLGGKTSFIFVAAGVLSVVYLYFCQPETAGRTFAELDEMFIKGVPARSFRSYQTEAELGASGGGRTVTRP